MKAVVSSVWEVAKIIIIAALIVAPLRLFVFQPFLVNGASMEPNFHHGDYLIVDELTYRFRDPKRGEVIVFKFPDNPSQRYIKRIIGLPGETVEVENGVITITNSQGGEEVVVLDEAGYLPRFTDTEGDVSMTLGEGEFFMLGDNRKFSYDSRRWGAVTEDLIIGRTLFRLLPPNAFAKVDAPAY